MDNTSAFSDIVLHFDKNVDLQVKLACKKFRKWLKLNNKISTIVQVYVKADEKVITRNKESVVGIFSTPYNKYPYIKIAAGDFQDLKNKTGIYNAIMSTLDTFAHEIVHYNQWISNRPYKENEADRIGKKMFEEYSDFKNGILIASNKVLKLIEKGDKYRKAGNYIKAVGYYGKVIEINPYIDSIFY